MKSGCRTAANENEIPAENSAAGKSLFYAAWRQQVQQQQVAAGGGRLQDRSICQIW